MIVCSPILLLAAANALARQAGCDWTPERGVTGLGRGNEGARFVQLAGVAAHHDCSLGVSSWPLRARATIPELRAELARARLLQDEGVRGDLLIAHDREGMACRVGIVLRVIQRRRPAGEPPTCECDVLWGELRRGGRVIAARQRGWFGAAGGYCFSPWYLLDDVRTAQDRRAA